MKLEWPNHYWIFFKLELFVFTMKKRRSKTMAEAVKYLYLPDEIWECVFKFLDEGDDYDLNCCLKSISLVSKQFFFITNRLRFSLTIFFPTIPFLCHLFHRFKNLRLTNFLKNVRSIFLMSNSHTYLRLSNFNLQKNFGGPKSWVWKCRDKCCFSFRMPI